MATEPIVLKTKVDTTGVKEGKKTIQDVIGQLDNELSKSGKEIEKALSQGSAKSADLAQKLQIANKELAESSREAMNLKEQLDNINNATASDNIVKKSRETLSIEKEVAKWQKTINDLGREQLEIDTKIANAKKILSDGSASVESQYEAQGALTVATERQTALNIKIREAQFEYDRLSEAYDKAFSKDKQNAIDKVTTKLNTQQTKVAKLTTKTKTLGSNLSDSMKRSLPEMDKFTKRVVGLAKRVFIFTVITRAFRAIRDYFGELSQGNAEFQQSLANLKFALQTLVTPLYNLVLPALKLFIDYLTKITMTIVNLIAKLTGKSVDSIMNNTKALQKQAKALKDTAKSAKDAKKELASFDQLNILEDNKSKETESLDTTANYQPNSGQLSTIVSSAFSEVEETISEFLFVLGAILICFGLVGPGIALMAIGIIGKYEEYKENYSAAAGDVKKLTDIILKIIFEDGLIVVGMLFCIFGQIGLGVTLLVAGIIIKGYKEAAKSDLLSEDVKNTLTGILAIVAPMIAILGIILLCTGNVAWGIGLLIAGISLFRAAKETNPDNKVVKIVSEVIGTLLAIASGAALVIGILLCLTGAGLPAGLALIASSFALGKGASSLSSNPLVNFVKNMINGVISVVEKGVNGIIGLLNKISWDVPDWVPLIGGTKVGFNLKKVNIPRLATGAVLPANKPFLAQLGDQKNGRNLELPENLLRQIVREEVNTNFTIEATGSMSQLIRLLNLKITQEQKRVSVF